MPFPLAFPTSVSPEEVFVRRRTAAGVSTSPTSYQSQVYQHPGARWEIDVKLPPMSPGDAAAWTQFFFDLQGRVGTFAFNLDPHVAGLLIGVAAEIFTVDFTAQTPASLAGKYLTSADAVGAIYCWFRLDGVGVDPAPGGRGILVAISTGQTAAQLATSFAAAVSADLSFNAIAAANVATVTNATTGARADATAGTTTTAVATTQQGSAGVPPGVRTFRLSAPDPGWSARINREYGFGFAALEEPA